MIWLTYLHYSDSLMCEIKGRRTCLERVIKILKVAVKNHGRMLEEQLASDEVIEECNALKLFTAIQLQF